MEKKNKTGTSTQFRRRDYGISRFESKQTRLRSKVFPTQTGLINNTSFNIKTLSKQWSFKEYQFQNKDKNIVSELIN